MTATEPSKKPWTWPMPLKELTPEQKAKQQAAYNHEYRSEVAVYVLYDATTRKVLMEWRTPPWPPCNLWCFGSGRVDQGETPAAAAIRELREELDLVALDAESLGVVFDQTGRAFHPFIVTKWIGDVPFTNADEDYPLGWFDLKKLPSVINDVTRMVANLVVESVGAGEPPKLRVVGVEPVA